MLSRLTKGAWSDAQQEDQSCENIPAPSFNNRGVCCDCGDIDPSCERGPGGIGGVDSALTQDGFSPFGGMLSMSQGYSGVIDSGTAGLGSIPAGCGSCAGGGSIPAESQMMRFRWSRQWRSTWQHPGSLGRGMYSNYDYFLIRSLDTIELRDPNTGLTERFVFSGGSFIPAPGVEYRSRICAVSGWMLLSNQLADRKVCHTGPFWDGLFVMDWDWGNVLVVFQGGGLLLAPQAKQPGLPLGVVVVAGRGVTDQMEPSSTGDLR